MFSIFLLFALAVLVVIYSYRGIVIVQEAKAMIIERLGRYHRTLESGVNIIFPIFDKPRLVEWSVEGEERRGVLSRLKYRSRLIDLREQIWDFPRQNVITRDNVLIEINALLYFQITDPVKAVYEISNLIQAIEKLTQTTLRNLIGELDLDATLSSRDTVNQAMRVILDEATDKWGVKVNRVELQDIAPPEDIRTAMEKQMRAERDKRAVVLEAQGYKDAAIARAEGEKTAAILRAEGEAEARIKVAHAEAAAIYKISHVTEKTRSDPDQYLITLRYIEALKEMVSGDKTKVVYMPYEASAILSSLGSVRDLFQIKPEP